MRIIKTYVLAVIVFASTITYAVTIPGKISVQITIVPSCTISANTLSFGQYSSDNSLDASTTLNVLCTSGTSYQIALDAGKGKGATVMTRKLVSGSNILNYSLYQDCNRTTVWGDTKDSNTVSGAGTGLTQNIIIYGKIFSNQLSPSGDYNDVITATIYF